MSKRLKRSIIGIILSLLFGGLLAYAGSQGSVSYQNWSLFGLCIGLVFLIQWLVFIPSFINKTDKFYDLTGSITYITTLVIAVALGPERDFRSILLAGLIAVWAIRLGSFLYARIKRDGHDSRFDEIKTNFPHFLMAWTMQGLWVSMCLAAALCAITSVNKVEFGWIGILGLAIWLLGFSIEVIADNQKKKFKANPSNKGKFINVGLWRWSRHPNYFGEIILWIGIATIAVPTLEGWQLATLISPFFVIFLLTKVSGIPMVEASADKKWGGQKDYESYKEHTPVLIMKPPK